MTTSTAPLTEAELRQINPRVRLTPREQLALRTACQQVLTPDCTVYLYGSRTDRNARGGDIDLLIVDPGLAPERELQVHAALFAALEAHLGERRVDLLFTRRLDEQATPFVQHVAPTAVRLWP